ncbi:hypothetical protein RB195_007531 [Necator americanus]|uniref:Uncharacterized protein n=1 Tax=Necator americanus TaxID=51031 RepID=A0ABR1BXQ4_NECAM
MIDRKESEARPEMSDYMHGRLLSALFHQMFEYQLEGIATTGVMPSANGALSKLLCSCYNPKQERGIAGNETTDRYEAAAAAEKEHRVDQGEPSEEPRQNTEAKVVEEEREDEKVDEKDEKIPANATEEVTTPINEEIAEDQLEIPGEYDSDVRQSSDYTYLELCSCRSYSSNITTY